MLFFGPQFKHKLFFIAGVRGGIRERGIKNVDKLNKSTNTL